MSVKTLPHDHGHSDHLDFDHMPEAADFAVLSDTFKLLSDSSRVKIFWLLCHCEECVINISAMMDMGSPAVSHHLKLLRAGNLICSRREGKEVYYRAADTPLVSMLHDMVENIVKISCPNL